jgi:hypothetical protein
MTRQIGCSPAVHDAIRSDDAAWSSLAFLKILNVDDETPDEIFEVRNCTVCHSTLYRQVRP